MEGLRGQLSVEITKDNQHVRQALRALSGNSYYTKIIISDCKVTNLKLSVRGKTVVESGSDRDNHVLEFPDKRIQSADVEFDVAEVSLFGKVVINIHKHSDTVEEFYS